LKKYEFNTVLYFTTFFQTLKCESKNVVKHKISKNLTCLKITYFQTN